MKMPDIGTKEFAEKFEVKQANVARWCREGLIPNARQDAKGSPWHIPPDAVPPISNKRKSAKEEK